MKPRDGHKGELSAVHCPVEAPNPYARQAENARISGQKRIKVLEFNIISAPARLTHRGKN